MKTYYTDCLLTQVADPNADMENFYEVSLIDEAQAEIAELKEYIADLLDELDILKHKEG